MLGAVVMDSWPKTRQTPQLTQVISFFSAISQTNTVSEHLPQEGASG
jgi:hypothetical protein